MRKGPGPACHVQKDYLHAVALVDYRHPQIAVLLQDKHVYCSCNDSAIYADGEHVLCGSEDGLTSIWHVETATETLLPHMALGGAPVYCMAWSSCFHAVAVCSFSPYAPIRVLCYSPDEPVVQLNPHKASAASKQQKRLANPQKVSHVSSVCSRHSL